MLPSLKIRHGILFSFFRCLSLTTVTISQSFRNHDPFPQFFLVYLISFIAPRHSFRSIRVREIVSRQSFSPIHPLAWLSARYVFRELFISSSNKIGFALATDDPLYSSPAAQTERAVMTRFFQTSNKLSKCNNFSGLLLAINHYSLLKLFQWYHEETSKMKENFERCKKR